LTPGKKGVNVSKILFWLVWNVPLGKLAPFILGLALGKMPFPLDTGKE